MSGSGSLITDVSVWLTLIILTFSKIGEASKLFFKLIAAADETARPLMSIGALVALVPSEWLFKITPLGTTEAISKISWLKLTLLAKIVLAVLRFLAKASAALRVEAYSASALVRS